MAGETGADEAVDDSLCLLQTARASVQSRGSSAAKGAGIQVSGRAWTRTEEGVGDALLCLVPVLGFALTLAAIVGTWLRELFSPGGAPPDLRKRGQGVQLGPLETPGCLRGKLPHPWPEAGCDKARPDRHAEGLLPSLASQQQVAPNAGAAGGRHEVTVIVSSIQESGILGVNLAGEDLRVTGFADPRAMRCGFVIGDRVLGVNGIAVCDQEGFVSAFDEASEKLQLLGAPMVFHVLRGETEESASPREEKESTSPHEEKDWSGAWQCNAESAQGGPLDDRMQSTAQACA